jgi:chitin synthase
MDLGAAASGKGAKKDEVILAVPTEEKDINALYADELKLLAEPIPVVKPTRSKTQKQEDYYKVSPAAVLFSALMMLDTDRDPHRPLGPTS